MIPVTFEEFTALAMKAPSIQAATAAGFVRVEVPSAIQWAREYTEPDRKSCEGISFFMSDYGIIIGGDSHCLIQRKGDGKSLMIGRLQDSMNTGVTWMGQPVRFQTQTK